MATARGTPTEARQRGGSWRKTRAGRSKAQPAAGRAPSARVQPARWRRARAARRRRSPPLSAALRRSLRRVALGQAPPRRGVRPHVRLLHCECTRRPWAQPPRRRAPPARSRCGTSPASLKHEVRRLGLHDAAGGGVPAERHVHRARHPDLGQRAQPRRGLAAEEPRAQALAGVQQRLRRLEHGPHSQRHPLRASRR